MPQRVNSLIGTWDLWGNIELWSARANTRATAAIFLCWASLWVSLQTGAILLTLNSHHPWLILHQPGEVCLLHPWPMGIRPTQPTNCPQKPAPTIYFLGPHTRCRQWPATYSLSIFEETLGRRPLVPAQATVSLVWIAEVCKPDADSN